MTHRPSQPARREHPESPAQAGLSTALGIPRRRQVHAPWRPRRNTPSRRAHEAWIPGQTLSVRLGTSPLTELPQGASWSARLHSNANAPRLTNSSGRPAHAATLAHAPGERSKRLKHTVSQIAQLSKSAHQLSIWLDVTLAGSSTIEAGAHLIAPHRRRTFTQERENVGHRRLLGPIQLHCQQLFRTSNGGCARRRRSRHS